MWPETKLNPRCTLYLSRLLHKTFDSSLIVESTSLDHIDIRLLEGRYCSCHTSLPRHRPAAHAIRHLANESSTFEHTRPNYHNWAEHIHIVQGQGEPRG